MRKRESFLWRITKRTFGGIWKRLIGEDRYYLNRFPFNLNYRKRSEHCHILAGSGHGKTQYLLNAIYRDLLQARKKGGGGICVIDSQGDLIQTIRRLDLLSKNHPSQLWKKVAIIDPEDVSMPVALNVFDVNLERMKKIKDPAIRETVMTATLSLFEYVFSDLISGGLTLYQKNIYTFCSKLLMEIPGANIRTFLELLQDGSRFRHDFEKLDDMSKRFFHTEFFSKKYEGTKEQIATRLWNILSHETFQRMLCSHENKVDFFQLMNEGSIILISTSKALMQEERCKILGRFFIAMIAQATYQRGVIPESARVNFTVFVDEVHDYFSDQIADFLSQARKYKVSMVIAHQYLAQLDHISKNLKASVMANTGTKVLGKMELGDADYFSKRVRVDSHELADLKKVGRYAEFYCYVRDMTHRARKVRIPLGLVQRKKKMTHSDQTALMDHIHERFCEERENPKIGEITIAEHVKSVPPRL